MKRFMANPTVNEIEEVDIEAETLCVVHHGGEIELKVDSSGLYNSYFDTFDQAMEFLIGKKLERIEGMERQVAKRRADLERLKQLTSNRGSQ